jgi:hypothetical protein
MSALLAKPSFPAVLHSPDSEGAGADAAGIEAISSSNTSYCVRFIPSRA